MREVKNEIGNRYGKLVVVSRAPNKPIGKSTSSKGFVHWLCHCDCGNNVTVFAGHLRRNVVKSCGCNRHLHGFGGHPLYASWYGLLKRNGNEVCAEWQDRTTGIQRFVRDMSNGFKRQMILVRIDSSKPYSKKNCRWVRRKEFEDMKRAPTVESDYGFL